MDDATKRKVDAMWKSLGIPEDGRDDRAARRARRPDIAHRGSRLLVYANFVKLPHTLFALPFALVGVVLASYHAPVTCSPMIGWIVLAFTCARFAAMGFNRIVDREIDARNPRTRQREIPSGSLTVAEAVRPSAIASVVFVYAAWRLNPLCAMLSPIALAWVFFYSYTKRFTRGVTSCSASGCRSRRSADTSR